MHIDRSFFGWGLFFILVGAVPLAVQGGAITAAQVADWWRFWPLILIGIGLAVLLRRTPLEALGGLVVAATFGIMVGALLSGGLTGVGGLPGGVCGALDQPTPFATQSGTLAGPSATVRIRLDCGDATVVTRGGAGWQVDGEDATGGGPDVESDPGELSVESADTDRGPFGWLGTRERWEIRLPTAPRLDLDAKVNAGSSTFVLLDAELETVGLELNAGSATIDLGGARAVGAIDIQLNAGSLGLSLPAVPTTGTIEANAGSVRICAPPGVALRLRTDDSVLASYDYGEHGLVQDGSTWSTPGYDTAPVRIDLTTEGNAGSFSLDPEEGCGA
jgi:hypothetical protein